MIWYLCKECGIWLEIAELSDMVYGRKVELEWRGSQLTVKDKVQETPLDMGSLRLYVGAAKDQHYHAVSEPLEVRKPGFIVCQHQGVTLFECEAKEHEEGEAVS